MSEYSGTAALRKARCLCIYEKVINEESDTADLQLISLLSTTMSTSNGSTPTFVTTKTQSTQHSPSTQDDPPSWGDATQMNGTLGPTHDYFSKSACIINLIVRLLMRSGHRRAEASTTGPSSTGSLPAQKVSESEALGYMRITFHK